jgi:predicted aconitase with swiveling domain
MYLTNSAGILVSNVVNGNQVAGVVATTAMTAGSSTGSYVYQLNFPYAPGLTASL